MMRIARTIPVFLTIGAAFLAVGSPAAHAITAEELADNQCFVCHQEFDEKPLYSTSDLERDLHMNTGILCEDCHGGDATTEDMEESMDPEAGFVGVPDATAVPEFCGRCHSDAAYMARYNPSLPVDQVQKYRTSRHGERLAMGDGKAAQCVSCHGAHGILPVKNTTSPVYDVNIPKTCAGCHADPEYMAEYDIPTDQYQKYSRSVHGVALLDEHDTGSPACNDCHGNHGAVPPGATSVANVCSLCHARTSELFSDSPHKAAFDANGWPECDQCHGNHDVRETNDAMLGTSPPSVCISCHKTDEDPGYRVAEQMKGEIGGLADRLESSEEDLSEVRNLGMETADIELAIRGIRQNLIKARTLVHTVSVDRIEPEIAEGTKSASEAVQLANAAVSEYHFRRKGLGISTLIITFVAVMLYFKIRQVERRQSRQE